MTVTSLGCTTSYRQNHWKRPWCF